MAWNPLEEGLLGQGGYKKFTKGGALDRSANEYAGVDQNNFNLPGYQQQYGQYGTLAGQYGSRQAPQAADSGFRYYQAGLARSLMQDMNGNGPGQQLVRMQAQDAADRAAQQQMAMAAGGRPGMAGMQYRNSAMNAANMQSQVGGQAAMAGLQARLAAAGQLGQVSQAGRGQDLQLNQFNADARLRQMGLNDQAQLEALRQRLLAAQMQQQGGMGYEQARTQRFGAMMGAPTPGEGFLGFMGGLSGGLMSMAGAGGAGGGGGGGGALWTPGSQTPSSGVGYYPKSF